MVADNKDATEPSILSSILFYGRFIVTEYLSHMFCLTYHNPVFSSFMTYYRVCKKSSTTGVTSGAETAYPSGATDSPWFLVGFMLLNL